jgi:hypothetical protein
MPTLSRRTTWILGTGVLILGLLGTLSWVGRRRVYRTVAGTETVLAAAGVVPGAPVGRVLAVLDSLGASYSELNADRTVGARIGRSFEDFFIHGDIVAKFRFDSTGHLMSHTVREGLTGP